METLECPRCGVAMDERRLGDSAVRRCPDGHGVFLERVALADLIDAENDWHRAGEGFHTAPLPRITADMSAPPPAARRAPAWVATLFD